MRAARRPIRYRRELGDTGLTGVTVLSGDHRVKLTRGGVIGKYCGPSGLSRIEDAGRSHEMGVPSLASLSQDDDARTRVLKKAAR